MKQMLSFLIVALVVLTGCNNNERLTAWGLSAPNNDLTARVGLENEKGDTEVGFTAKYLTTSEIPWGPEPDLVGAYMIFHLTQDVTIEDTPQPSILQPWLESLHARPYAGLELVGPIDGHGRKVQPNWLLGTSFTVEPLGDWALVTEYVAGDQVVEGWYVGGKLRF